MCSLTVAALPMLIHVLPKRNIVLFIIDGTDDVAYSNLHIGTIDGHQGDEYGSFFLSLATLLMLADKTFF